MAFQYYVALMPSASATNVTWLNTLGSKTTASYLGGAWQLVNVVPVSPVNSNGEGNVMCYFISGSAT
jgi:hypothetical protein